MKTDYELLIEWLSGYGLIEEQAKEIANGLDNTKLYVCVKDRQGSDFGVGRIKTELQWALTALEWSVGDESSWEDEELEEMFDWIKSVYAHDYIIPYISKTWEIIIEEYQPTKLIIDLEELDFRSKEKLLDLLYLIEDFEEYDCSSISISIRKLQDLIKCERERLHIK